MDQIFDRMERGEAWAAPYYAGDYLTMVEENPDLGFSHPKEGFNIFIDAMCIAKGCQNKAGAEVETVRAVLAATTEKHYKELMADKPMPLEPSQQDAKESIMALLKEQGPMAGMDLKKLVMDETGCSKRTVERAHTCLVKEKKILTKRVRQADGKFKFITSLCAVRAVRRLCGEVA